MRCLSRLLRDVMLSWTCRGELRLSEYERVICEERETISYYLG